MALDSSRSVGFRPSSARALVVRGARSRERVARPYRRSLIGPGLLDFVHKEPGVIVGGNPNGRYLVVYCSGLASEAARGWRIMATAARMPGGPTVAGFSLPASDGRVPTWAGKPDPIAIAKENLEIIVHLARGRPVMVIGTSGGAEIGAITARMLQSVGIDVVGYVGYGMPTPALRKRWVPDQFKEVIPGGLVERFHSRLDAALQDEVDELLALKEVVCQLLPEAEVRRFMFTAVNFLRNGDKGEESTFDAFQRVIIDYFVLHREHTLPLSHMLNTLGCEQSVRGLRNAGVPTTLLRGSQDTICTDRALEDFALACEQAGVPLPATYRLAGKGHLSLGADGQVMQDLREGLFHGMSACVDKPAAKRDAFWQAHMNELSTRVGPAGFMTVPERSTSLEDGGVFADSLARLTEHVKSGAQAVGGRMSELLAPSFERGLGLVRP